MSECRYCGHLEQETPQVCPTCDSVMFWAQVQYRGLWSGYQKKRAERLGLWMWQCPNAKQDWHKDAEALLKWAEQCPDSNTANFAIVEAKSMLPEEFDGD